MTDQPVSRRLRTGRIANTVPRPIPREDVRVLPVEERRCEEYWRRGVYFPGAKCTYIKAAHANEQEKNGVLDLAVLKVWFSDLTSIVS